MGHLLCLKPNFSHNSLFLSVREGEQEQEEESSLITLNYYIGAFFSATQNLLTKGILENLESIAR